MNNSWLFSQIGVSCVYVIHVFLVLISAWILTLDFFGVCQIEMNTRPPILIYLQKKKKVKKKMSKEKKIEEQIKRVLFNSLSIPLTFRAAAYYPRAEA